MNYEINENENIENETIEKFKKWLLLQGMADNTVSAYTINLKKYYTWCKKEFKKTPDELYRVNIDGYIRNLNKDKLSTSSKNGSIDALKKFNEYLVGEGIQEGVVIYKTDRFKDQNMDEVSNPCEIYQSDVEAFRQFILEGRGKKEVSKTITIRNYAIITTLAYGGLRISESLNLELTDVNVISGEMKIRKSKRKKSRIVFMNDKIIDAIKEYLKVRPETESDILFISNFDKAGGVHRSNINKLFNEYHKDIITPHQLRHFFCTHMLERNFTLHEVMMQAGHENIQTTMKYLFPRRKELRDRMRDL